MHEISDDSFAKGEAEGTQYVCAHLFATPSESLDYRPRNTDGEWRLWARVRARNFRAGWWGGGSGRGGGGHDSAGSGIGLIGGNSADI